jgi:hypothetical protein
LKVVEGVEGVEGVEEFKVFSLRFKEPSKFNSLGFQPQVIDKSCISFFILHLKCSSFKIFFI